MPPQIKRSSFSRVNVQANKFINLEKRFNLSPEDPSSREKLQYERIRKNLLPGTGLPIEDLEPLLERHQNMEIRIQRELKFIQKVIKNMESMLLHCTRMRKLPKRSKTPISLPIERTEIELEEFSESPTGYERISLNNGPLRGNLRLTPEWDSLELVLNEGKEDWRAQRGLQRGPILEGNPPPPVSCYHINIKALLNSEIRGLEETILEMARKKLQFTFRAFINTVNARTRLLHITGWTFNKRKLIFPLANKNLAKLKKQVEMFITKDLPLMSRR